jgi:hypothetical protein
MFANEGALDLLGALRINLALALHGMDVMMGGSVMGSVSGGGGTVRSSREGGSGDQACAYDNNLARSEGKGKHSENSKVTVQRIYSCRLTGLV